MFKINVQGFDELQKHLEGVAERAREMDGQEQVVSLAELMPDDFVAEHSSCTSMEELLSASPFKIESLDDFKAVPDADWDAYIASKTSFSSWEEMQESAVAARVQKMLGL
jgi:hypothetical protein